MPPELTVSLAVEQLLSSAGPAGEASEASVGDWLLNLASRYRGMLDRMLSPEDVASLSLLTKASATGVAAGATLSTAALRSLALENARSAGADRVVERHVLEAVLGAAGYTIRTAAPVAPRVRNAPADPTPATAVISPATSAWHSRATKPTPALDQFGSDLTRAASEGRLAPMIGRTAELDRIVHTLCRRIKRNPLLVGAAGTGKTAIIEGLAQRIVDGNVPPMLAGSRVIVLQPSSLVAGASMAGEFPNRVRAVIAEASQDGILLFIDEVHTALGAGGMAGTQDFAQQLKPALARGDFACIAATTDDEYRVYIASDEALARRFDTIKIHEMTPAEAMVVLKRMRDDPRISRGVTLGDDSLDVVIDFGTRYLRNRRFPDKAVDLFDHLVAAALTRQQSSIAAAEADHLLRELFGVQENDGVLLESLEHRIVERGLLTDEDASMLADRLAVTTQGLDMNASRPNATVLLMGEAADRVDELASLIAESLFGSPSRVVSIDFSTMVEEHSVTALLGSPPSYVGYDDRHALDGVAESPLTVVIGRNIDKAHPRVRAAFEPALDRGFITDMRGRRIFFSDAVVLMTTLADADASPALRVAGFGGAALSPLKASDTPVDAHRLFGERTADYLDLAVTAVPAVVRPKSKLGWVHEAILSSVTLRLGARGINVEWDETIVKWLQAAESEKFPDKVARVVEREILPVVVAKAFAADATPGAVRLLVRRAAGEIEVSRVV